MFWAPIAGAAAAGLCPGLQLIAVGEEVRAFLLVGTFVYEQWCRTLSRGTLSIMAGWCGNAIVLLVVLGVGFLLVSKSFGPLL